MKSISKSLQKGFYSATALLFASMAFLPLAANAAAAGGQVTTRYLKMSSTVPSATSAIYSIAFNPGSSYTLKGIIVDFCDSASTPLIGTTCTAPAGFTMSGTPTVSNNPDGTATVDVLTGFTVGSLNSGRTLSLTYASGIPVTTASLINFSINTITNPSTIGTFYARVLTYTTNTPAYTAGSEGTYQDYGGFALSTAAAISVTARVMETLNFCVYTTSCGDSTAIELGTGTPAAIGTALSTKGMKFSLSTNANGGATVRLKGDTLKSGSNSIAAVGATNSAIGTGSGLFGVRVDSVTATTGTMTAAPTYNSTTNFGLNTTNTKNTYGDTFATSTGALDSAVGTFTYGVAAANTTPAGVYTAQHQLIATGTF